MADQQRDRFEGSHCVSSREAEIAAEVFALLRQSPYRSIRELTCEVTPNAVVLEGRVATYHEKQVAQETIREVEGVQRIVNRIAVGAQQPG